MRELKVLMLSWEFPPRIIGGIAAHVHDLSLALSRRGINISVLTCDFPGTEALEEIDGVEVHRVDSYKFPTSNFASWVYMMNLNMEQYAIEVIKSEIKRGTTVLLHCHDWLMAKAAIGLKHLFRLPLLATIHSTEHGRRKGIHSDYQRMIHQTESWLAHEGWRIICCSDYMATQVSSLFGLPRVNIDIIPNGVNMEEYSALAPSQTFRQRYAKDSEKLVLYVGRLVYEKGVTVLINSIQRVLQRVEAKFIIVGDGYMRDRLIGQTRRLRLDQRIYFTGFLDVDTVRGLYSVADVFVVPSLYEPFGIVALEGMASGVPVVASGVGGLLEIIEHDKTGVTVYPDNPESLAWGILKVLTDNGYSDKIKKNASQHVSDYFNWNNIAQHTQQVYQRVFKEYMNGSWRITSSK